MKDKLKKMLKRCWEGYKPTPGVKAYEKGSCIKKDELEKASNNVREQKKALFGSKGNPGKNSPKTDNQMTALNNLAQRRYGVDVKPSGGKIDEATGERRSDSPEVGVDKPDWRSGSIEAQQNPDAVTHELGHLEIMPEGVDAPNGQRLMDKEYAAVQKLHGYMKQKRSQGEIQPMAMENPIRRRAGVPATDLGIDVKPGTPERTAVDTGGPAAIRVPKGEKERDLIRQSRLMSPENRARLEDVDQGIVKYNPKRGWQPSHSGDALINLRAQGRHEEANKRSKAKFAMMMRRKKKAAPQKLAASELNKSKTDMPAIARRSGYQLGSKGIHQPTAKPGVSAVGVNVRSIKQPSEQKGIHQQKLAELKAMPKPNLPKAELEKAVGGSKNSKRSEHAKLKGVHTSGGFTGLSDKGQSQAGRNIERAKEPQPNKHLSDLYHGRGKQMHEEKLAELKAMPKPNLPKAELEKAKIDTGMPDQKAAKRATRNVRSATNVPGHKNSISDRRAVEQGAPGYKGMAVVSDDPVASGVHHGKQSVLAHQKKGGKRAAQDMIGQVRSQAKAIKPNLPK